MTSCSRLIIVGLVLILPGLIGGAVFAADLADSAQNYSFYDRIQTQDAAGITVRAGVPSDQESRDLFDTKMYKMGVQPVWLEITNESDETITFLPVGLDPAYFTPAEAAYGKDGKSEKSERQQVRQNRLFSSGINMSVPAGEQRSGFLFTSLDEGTKAFNVDIAGVGDFHTFTFFIPVPGLALDHHNIDWENLYPADQIKELDQAQLIDWVEAQVCCTTDSKAQGSGDPVNLVIIGNLDEVYTSFIRAGWDETETITAGTSWKTFKSFVGGGEYRYSPVSGLYVFGRPQDIALQKARSNIHERNHLRLWLSPIRYQGKLVWLGQISRDIGVRWTRKTITTHKIDADVDETRSFLLEDLAYAQAVAKFAYVGGVGEVSIEEPSGNLTGDPWFSDGFRLVIWVTDEPVNKIDIELKDWRDRNR